jgi:hypothetical protein
VPIFDTYRTRCLDATFPSPISHKNHLQDKKMPDRKSAPQESKKNSKKKSPFSKKKKNKSAQKSKKPQRRDATLSRFNPAQTPTTPQLIDLALPQPAPAWATTNPSASTPTSGATIGDQRARQPSPWNTTQPSPNAPTQSTPVIGQGRSSQQPQPWSTTQPSPAPLGQRPTIGANRSAPAPLTPTPFIDFDAPDANLTSAPDLVDLSPLSLPSPAQDEPDHTTTQNLNSTVNDSSLSNLSPSNTFNYNAKNTQAFQSFNSDFSNSDFSSSNFSSSSSINAEDTSSSIGPVDAQQQQTGDAALAPVQKQIRENHKLAVQHEYTNPDDATRIALTENEQRSTGWSVLPMFKDNLEVDKLGGYKYGVNWKVQYHFDDTDQIMKGRGTTQDHNRGDFLLELQNNKFVWAGGEKKGQDADTSDSGIISQRLNENWIRMAKSLAMLAQQQGKENICKEIIQAAINQDGNLCKNYIPSSFDSLSPDLSPEDLAHINKMRIDYDKLIKGQKHEDALAEARKSGDKDKLDELAKVDTSDMNTSFAGLYIFVMNAAGQFFAGESLVGIQHHSSFLGGGAVAAAGEIRINGGIITEISNISGHYRPGPVYLWQACKQLASQGINLANVAVEVACLDEHIPNAAVFLESIDPTEDGRLFKNEFALKQISKHLESLNQSPPEDNAHSTAQNATAEGSPASNYTDAPKQSNYTDAPKQSNYTDIPKQSNYTDIPKQSNYTDMPKQSNYTDMPKQSNYTDIPKQSNYTDIPKQSNYIVTPSNTPAQQRSTSSSSPTTSTSSSSLSSSSSYHAPSYDHKTPLKTALTPDVQRAHQNKEADAHTLLKRNLRNGAAEIAQPDRVGLSANEEASTGWALLPMLSDEIKLDKGETTDNWSVKYHFEDPGQIVQSRGKEQDTNRNDFLLKLTDGKFSWAGGENKDKSVSTASGGFVSQRYFGNFERMAASLSLLASKHGDTKLALSLSKLKEKGNRTVTEVGQALDTLTPQASPEDVAHLNKMRADYDQLVNGNNHINAIANAKTKENNEEELAALAKVDTSNMNLSFTGIYIFVMNAAGQFFAGESLVGIQHHSSFLAGGAVAAAGEVRINDGVLSEISNVSGHYKPGPAYLWQACKQLEAQGINLESVQVEVATLIPSIPHAKAFLDALDPSTLDINVFDNAQAIAHLNTYFSAQT